MKEKIEVKNDLMILWEMRDNAKNIKERKEAQANIDEYFLGKPEKKVRKKDRKKKAYIPIDDDWEY